MSDLTHSATFVPEIPEEQGERNTRRAFLAAAGAAGICYAAALAYCFVLSMVPFLAVTFAVGMEISSELALGSHYAEHYAEVTLKDAQKLPAGSVLMFKFGTAPAMLIHHENGQWIALSAVCSHLGCTVQYEPEADRIHCACHGGVYNAYTGANVSGPPPRPLRLFKTAISDTGVEVSRA